jgi:predicted ATPase
MPYIKSLHINTEKTNPFPYNVSGIKYAKNLDLSNKINFFVGDNGTGKSTLIETIAFRLQLPHMDGSDYSKTSFQAAVKLASMLELKFNIRRSRGFFFRAEDFGDYLNSVNRADAVLHSQLKSLEGEVPHNIIQEMKDNSNSQIYHMRKNYGQELNSFSHGEAYLKIIQEKLQKGGIYLLDEPEAALSPAKQLSLIYTINEHLKSNISQFIIATHSPILMSIPNAIIFEITDEGMERTNLEDTEHYKITKNFLNNPELYLRHLK